MSDALIDSYDYSSFATFSPSNFVWWRCWFCFHVCDLIHFLVFSFRFADTQLPVQKLFEIGMEIVMQPIQLGIVIAYHCYPCIVGGGGCGGGKKLLVILLITCKYIRSATGCSSQYQAIKFFIQNTLNITTSHGNESRLGEQQPSRKTQRARNLMKKKKNAQKKQILYVHKVLSSAPCILFAICLNISLTFYWSHFYHFFTAIRLGKNEFLVKFKAMVGMFL